MTELASLAAPTELDRRRITLGGSTIAAACGVDPYVSPIRLWCELTGRIAREPSEAMEWGKRLEPVVKAALAVDGAEVLPALEHRDSARSWLVGHPDGILRPYPGVCHLLEVKASARGYDSPPVHYLAQVQTYLHLTGYDVGVIATLAGLHLDVAEVERSRHEIDLLLGLAADFMRHVWDDTQPPPSGHADDRGALIELYPTATPRVTRETREIRDARRELALLLEREKAQKARIEALRATITDYMQDADTLIDAHDTPVATWKNVSARRLDTARLRQEAPDVYERFAVPQPNRRFTLA